VLLLPLLLIIIMFGLHWFFFTSAGFAFIQEFFDKLLWDDSEPALNYETLTSSDLNNPL
jgi:hypothetical protein